MRVEIQSILSAKGYDYFGLPLIARLLLVTDGTVTELLEAMVMEPIKLGHKKLTIDNIDNHPIIQNTHRNVECLHRAVTLRGEKTGVDWIYAESIIFHKLLSPVARSMLIEEEMPIGIILNAQTSDNHRRIVDCDISSNTVAAEHLKLDPMYEFVYRVYQIMVGTELIMNISEWFPIDRISDSIVDIP